MSPHNVTVTGFKVSEHTSVAIGVYGVPMARDPGHTDSVILSFTNDSTHPARYMAARS